MTPIKPIMRLTPSVCHDIQSRMLEACREVVARYGLVVESNRWRDMEPGLCFEPTFRVSIPNSDGTAFNLEKESFEVLAEHFGLSPSDYGREFTTGHERFRITGIDPKRPRYPISAERMPDRKGFKFTAENVALLLQSKGRR